MGKFYAFLLGILAGFGLYHVASSYHVLRAESGWHMIPKVSQSLGDTYVDIREFDPGDWAKHPEVAAAVIQSGNEALVTGAAETALDRTFEHMLPDASAE